MHLIIVMDRLHLLVGSLGAIYKERVSSYGSHMYLEKYLTKIKYICCICILYLNTFWKLYLQLYLNTFLPKYLVFVFRYIFASILPVSARDKRSSLTALVISSPGLPGQSPPRQDVFNRHTCEGLHRFAPVWSDEQLTEGVPGLLQCAGKYCPLL